MTSLYDQPMIKLLFSLAPTICFLDSKGSVEVHEVPGDHLESIKQLERIGVVHKRNNRCYELQKVRLKKLLGSIGIETLKSPPPMVSAPVASVAPSPVAQPQIPQQAVAQQPVSQQPGQSVAPPVPGQAGSINSVIGTFGEVVESVNRLPSPLPPPESFPNYDLN